MSEKMPETHEASRGTGASLCVAMGKFPIEMASGWSCNGLVRLSTPQDNLIGLVKMI
ncbi:hypothetical protein PHLCEN_2v11650 [Hermanssonia centrifuga]|uniref:Uncharacterized protein n=1 Tax=Hermanssonia centrifuga TaxID=98765 RepID=A0A2R6NJD4_9APHY|nr:hypothetical protein PHLCEN_2v11650 [Hermanssonia centrifuga]